MNQGQGNDLTPGTRLGPYAILEPLGTGGMGEVHRARDTRLDRIVAIKVLPAQTAADPRARARFDREGRAIASLSHPNICALHDVGHDLGRDYLVMELLEGETLQQRLRRGPLEIDAIVDIGIAVADALDTAHARGVIHRDLKPANIFLTSRGQPKVLDFGVAKVLDSADEATRAIDGLTGSGATVGTVAYMSPEQLRGEALDARTDLFSFGLVLYEMATGRRAFEGRSGADISAAILGKEPTTPRELRADLPARLEELILQLLDKDREMRCQTAAEARADLRRLKAQLPSVRSSSLSSAMPESGPAAPPSVVSTTSDSQIVLGLVRRHRTTVALAVLLLIAAIIWLGSLAWRSPAGGRSENSSFAALQIQPLTFTGDAPVGAISADGRFVAYVRANSVRVRQILTDSDVEILPAGRFQRFNSLTVTPDGNYVDAVAVSGGKSIPDLWRIPLLGGAPKRVLEKVQSAPGWSPDGQRFAFIRSEIPSQGASIIVADVDGLHERVLVTRKPPLMFFSDNVGSYFPQNRPAWASDGQSLVVAGASGAPDRRGNACELVFVDAASGRETRTDILSAQCFREVAWRDPSHLLASGGSTWRPGLVLWDLVSKTSSPLIQDFPAIGNVTVTADRRVAVATRVERRAGIWTSDTNGARLAARVPSSTAGAEQPFIDNEGALTYTAANREGWFSLHHLSPGSANPVVIANHVMYGEDPAAGAMPPPAVTADGRTVVFTEMDAPWALFKVNTDGSNLVKIVEDNTAGPAITADGQHVIFTPARGPGLYVVPLGGGAPRQLYDGPVVSPITVSPDGHRALFRSGRPGEVIVCELPGCGNPKPVRVPSVVWAPGGQGVVSIDPNDGRRLVETPLNGGPPRELVRLSDGGDPITSFAWSPNGKLLALSRGRWTTDVVLIKGLR